jgi:hypothetical protein
MNNPSTKNSITYSLHTLDNYKQSIGSPINDILRKYTALVVEYLHFITENINIKNNEYNKFIILRGIDTITHVFCIILYYSRNIDMAYYHGQKSFYFYVEFIGQISEEHHTFLQLSSRDAALFVYKKTIYEINNDNKKTISANSKDDGIKLEMLNNFISVVKSMTNYLMHGYYFVKENKKDLINEIIHHIEYICQNMNNSKISNEFLETIKTLIECVNKEISNDKYISIIELFIKKYSRHKIKVNNIREKILDVDFDKYLENTPERFISWIVSQ